MLDAIENGVKLLDENLGEDWVYKINLDKLDIASIYDCVLGQLYGNFDRGCRILKLDSTIFSLDLPQKIPSVYNCGFSGRYSNQLWKDTIKSLKEIRPAPPYLFSLKWGLKYIDMWL
jgi:hypothetical protein